MKRFAFTLEKTLRFREARLRAEEARFSLLAGSEASIQHRVRELRSGHLARRRALSRDSEMEGSQLERLHEYGEFVSIEAGRLAAECAELRAELARQAAKVAACKQGVELLGKLRDKQKAQWERDAAKELQEAAEESFNARWLRELRAKASI